MNQVEIFDGDIIAVTHYLPDKIRRYVVKFYPEHASFMARCIETNSVHYLSNLPMCQAEVIGNVFDNHELLDNEERIQ